MTYTLTITNKNTGHTFREEVETEDDVRRRVEWRNQRSAQARARGAKGWVIRSCEPHVSGIATDADPAGDVFFLP